MSIASLRVNAIAHVTIDGVYLGIFDVSDGAQTKADIVKHRDGGQQGQTLLPVPPDTDTLTVERLYKGERDQALRYLRKRVGPGAVDIGIQDLDADRNAYGATETFTGLLSSYQVTGADSSSTDKRMLQLAFEVND